MSAFIINLMGVAALTVLFIVSKPTTWIREKILFLTEDNAHKYDWVYPIHYLCNCALCLGFWTGLYYTENIMYAALVSFMAEILRRILIKL